MFFYGCGGRVLAFSCLVLTSVLISCLPFVSGLRWFCSFLTTVRWGIGDPGSILHCRWLSRSRSLCDVVRWNHLDLRVGHSSLTFWMSAGKSWSIWGLFWYGWWIGSIYLVFEMNGLFQCFVFWFMWKYQQQFLFIVMLWLMRTATYNTSREIWKIRSGRRTT